MRFNGKMGKGFMTARRHMRRLEAEQRNAQTPHNRTKAHRLERCGC